MEYAKICEPVRVEGGVIRNLHHSRDTGYLRWRWRLEIDGSLIAQDELPVPPIAPGATFGFKYPAELTKAAEAADPGERWVTVEAVLAADEAWAPAGHLIAWGQTELEDVRGIAYSATTERSTLSADSPAGSLVDRAVAATVDMFLAASAASGRPAQDVTQLAARHPHAQARPHRTAEAIELGPAIFDPATGELLRLGSLPDRGPAAGPVARSDRQRALVLFHRSPVGRCVAGGGLGPPHPQRPRRGLRS